MIELQEFLTRAFKDKPFSEFHVQFSDDILIRVLHMDVRRDKVSLQYSYINGYIPKKGSVFTWDLKKTAAKYVVLRISVQHTADRLITVINVNSGE